MSKIPKNTAISSVTALVVAAGRGTRMGHECPKQYHPIHGKALLAYTLDRLCKHPKINHVLVVIASADQALYELALQHITVHANKILPPVFGGAERQDSVFAGLQALAKTPPKYVLIHDAARPTVSIPLIDRLLEALDYYPAALPALPIVDSLVKAEANQWQSAVDRRNLWRAQTPQAFHFKTIYAAHQTQQGQQKTDDIQLLAAQNLPIHLVQGEAENFKVTHPQDLERAEQLLQPQTTTTPSQSLPMVWRMGNGYDVHRFGKGDHVILCGVRIAHNAALMGHSDADVGMHAITDALYGAIAQGDIGRHFPPSDPQWKGADSAIFLRHAVALVTAQGGKISNIDLTLICEAPKIAPHAAAMRERIAALCQIHLSQVSIKATTSEQLGFTGRKEGIAAIATTMLAVPETLQPEQEEAS